MTKSWLASKTIWVNVIALIAAVLGAAGVAEISVEQQGTIVAVVMSIVNIVLRVATKEPLGK